MCRQSSESWWMKSLREGTACVKVLRWAKCTKFTRLGQANCGGTDLYSRQEDCREFKACWLTVNTTTSQPWQCRKTYPQKRQKKKSDKFQRTGRKARAGGRTQVPRQKGEDWILVCGHGKPPEAFRGG